MPLQTVQTTSLSQSLDTVLYQVEQQNRQFIIQRNRRAIARLVPEMFIQAIDALMENDPGLADTIALMMNKEAQQAIQGSLDAYQAGRAKPAKDIFNAILHPRREEL